MTPIRGLRLLIVLGCLAPLGCAGAGRYPLREPASPARRREPAPPKAADEHADLERELSLYSD